MRDRLASDLHKGSPQGLPSSKWRVSKQYHRDYFARWSWRMCSWFNNMCTLGPGWFFFSYRYWWFASTRREMPRRKSFNLISTGLFHLRYFEDGPLEPGYKMRGLQKKNKKKTLTWSPQKRSRPALTYHELLSSFIFPLVHQSINNVPDVCWWK